MIEFGQSSLLVVAYATGVLMVSAPCSVGLLPAYLTYFNTHFESGTTATPLASALRSIQWLARITDILGVGVFLAGALAVFGSFAAAMSTLMIGVSILTATTGRSVSLGRYAGRVRVLGSIGFVLIGSCVT